MIILDVINKLKEFYCGYVGMGKNCHHIDENSTRDRILFGNANQECTGIVTTCWASVSVIKEAINKDANLIICHESLFWNHGDHAERWESESNETFRSKKKLLSENEIVVWRNHDYIHSGVPISENTYIDGIFYGLAEKLGWTEYIDLEMSEMLDKGRGWNELATTDRYNPISFIIPEITALDLSRFLVKKLNLNGIRLLGNQNRMVKSVSICFHISGDADFEILYADKGKVDCYLGMEIVDFTLAEYIHDANEIGDGAVLICMGHFNIEEPGMEYMTEYISHAIGEIIPCYFVQSGDHYKYIAKEN